MLYFFKNNEPLTLSFQGMKLCMLGIKTHNEYWSAIIKETTMTIQNLIEMDMTNNPSQSLEDCTNDIKKLSEEAKKYRNNEVIVIVEHDNKLIMF